MKTHATAANVLLRIGSVAKALVYFLMGSFCLGTAFGIAYGTHGPQAVIRWLGQNPLGRATYLVLGLGIAAYALWRWYEAFIDPHERGRSAAAIFYRLNCLVVGGTYSFLAVYAFDRMFGNRPESGDVRVDLIQRILQFEYGQFITYAIAVGVVGAGISALYTGLSRKHMRDVDEYALSQVQEKWFSAVGVAGLGGVAIVYFIMAFSLYQAARLDQGNKFRGVGESLSALEGYDWRWFLLLATGVGLTAYGVFMGLKAWYEQQPGE